MKVSLPSQLYWIGILIVCATALSGKPLAITLTNWANFTLNTSIGEPFDPSVAPPLQLEPYEKIYHSYAAYQVAHLWLTSIRSAWVQPAARFSSVTYTDSALPDGAAVDVHIRADRQDPRYTTQYVGWACMAALQGALDFTPEKSKGWIVPAYRLFHGEETDPFGNLQTRLPTLMDNGDNLQHDIKLINSTHGLYAANTAIAKEDLSTNAIAKPGGPQVEIRSTLYPGLHDVGYNSVINLITRALSLVHTRSYIEPLSTTIRQGEGLHVGPTDYGTDLTIEFKLLTQYTYHITWDCVDLALRTVLLESPDGPVWPNFVTEAYLVREERALRLPFLVMSFFHRPTPNSSLVLKA